MIKINNLWEVIKKTTIVVSIIMNVTIIVFVLIILTHKISINIDESCVATTTNDIPLNMPISFKMGAITFKGDADVIIPKDTVFPLKIKMIVPLLESIRIKNKKETEPKNIKDAKQSDIDKSSDKSSKGAK